MVKAMFRTAIVAVLALPALGLPLPAQQPAYKISGRVVEESKGEALAGVAILEPATGRGVISNERGDFIFEAGSLPVVLVFSYLGYFADTLQVGSREQYRKLFEGHPVRISLRQNPFLIDEVVVKPSGEATRLFAEEPYAIMDYGLDGNRFFALGYRNFNPLKPEIFVGNPFGRLLSARSLPTAGEIYRDCQGKVYAVARDSVYQLNNQEDTLSLTAMCTEGFFQSGVRPIVALHDPHYIWFEKSKNGQFHDYFIGNYETGKKALFYRVGDDRHEQGFTGMNSQLRQEWVNKIEKSDIGAGEMRVINDRLSRMQFRMKQEFRPVQSVVLQMNDSALLFDFDRHIINCITISGQLLWRAMLRVETGRDFTGRIHRDPATNRFFLEFLNVQSSYLIEIDPRTGQALANIPIRQFRHIDHISVYDNRVFFLYQPDFGDKGKKLFFINL